MQVVEQMSRGARRAAPVVRDGAVREVSIHLARVHLTTLADELDQRLRPAPAPPRPARPVRARMHQRVQGSRHEAVVDEDVLLDVEGRVETFEVAGAVTLDAVSQGQILRARGRADRVGLHEPQVIEGALQRCGWEEAAADSKAPQPVQRDRHGVASLAPRQRRASGRQDPELHAETAGLVYYSTPSCRM